MECPGWLKEKNLGRLHDVNSWIKLANQNDNSEGDDGERKQFMEDFRVDDKAD